jgi:hypothetical protein
MYTRKIVSWTIFQTDIRVWNWYVINNEISYDDAYHTESHAPVFHYMGHKCVNGHCFWYIIHT